MSSCPSCLLCCEENDRIREQLLLLQHEFDAMGLPSINVNVDVLEQLIEAVHRLIQMHRRTFLKLNDISVERTSLIKESRHHEKLISSFDNKIKSKEKEMQGQAKIIRMKDTELECVRKEKSELKKELDALRKYYNRKENELYHRVLKLKEENHELRKRLGLDIGDFKSDSDIMVEALNKYKKKEVIYEDTISKLQQNNEKLLMEVLNLKEEVMLAFSRNDK